MAKMFTKNRKGGVILTYASEAIQCLLAIFYTPVVINILGKAEYGLYQVAGSVVGYLALLNMGCSSAYIKQYTQIEKNKCDEDINKLNGMFLIICSLIAGTALICGIFIVGKADLILGDKIAASEYKRTRIMLSVLIISMAITLWGNIFSAQQTVKEAYIFQRIVKIIQSILNPFLSLPLLLMGYKSVALTVITCVTAILKLFVDYIYSKKKLKMKYMFNGLDWGMLKQYFWFTLFILINSIVKQINWTVDKLIINREIGPEFVTVYSVGAKINEIYMQLASSISIVFAPQIYKAVSAKQYEEVGDVFAYVGKLQALILLYVFGGFIFGGKCFIYHWVGNGYENSYYVACILMFAAFLPMTQLIGVDVQRAMNKHQIRSVVYLILAVINVFLSIFLVRRFGVVGATLGTLISMIIGEWIWMNWYYVVRLKLPLRTYWKGIGRVTLAFIPTALVGIIWEKAGTIPIYLWCLYGIAYSCIFAVSQWFVGMSKTDRARVWAKLNKK